MHITATYSLYNEHKGSLPITKPATESDDTWKPDNSHERAMSRRISGA